MKSVNCTNAIFMEQQETTTKYLVVVSCCSIKIVPLYTHIRAPDVRGSRSHDQDCCHAHIFFLFLHGKSDDDDDGNICCGYSLEAPQQGSSNFLPTMCFHGEKRKIAILLSWHVMEKFYCTIL